MTYLSSLLVYLITNALVFLNILVFVISDKCKVEVYGVAIRYVVANVIM